MAVKLGIPSEPYWLDLPFGVRVLVRPCVTTIYQEAVQLAAEHFRKTRDAKVTLEEIGAEVIKMPNIMTEAGRAAYNNYCFVRFLARSAIIAWEGVNDEHEDKPAAVTDEAVDKLMEFHAVAEQFAIKYAGSQTARISEGNLSGPSAGGISAKGPQHAPRVQH